MPNVPGKGVWGRPDGAGIGAPTEMVEGVATLPATTAPLGITQVWIGGPTGTPVLVWSAVATPPTGASAAFSAPTQVTVSWVPASILAADSYLIKRPDGSTAGTAVGGSTTSFIDPDPRPLTGSYTVTAQLGSVSAAPVATNSLNLAAQTQSLAATNGLTNRVDLTWAHPTYGQPDLYLVYRDGVYLGPLGGNVTAWNDTSIGAGAYTYSIVAQLSGQVGGTAPSIVGTTIPTAPTSVLTGYNNGNGQLEVIVNSSLPGGYQFELEIYTTNTPVWSAVGTISSNVPSYSGPYPGPVTTGMGWYIRARTLKNGQRSAWVQSNYATWDY